MWAVGATATLAAVAAYFVLGGFLYVGGLPAEVALSPAAYAVFSLAALFNPLYAALLPILLPVRNHITRNGAPDDIAMVLQTYSKFSISCLMKAK